MKKFNYINDYGIEIITDYPDKLPGDTVIFFSNGIKDKRTNGFIYICDSARYPKRVAKKIGEFNSDGSTYINFNKYIFEKGNWIVYLNFKGNFYIYKE